MNVRARDFVSDGILLVFLKKKKTSFANIVAVRSSSLLIQSDQASIDFELRTTRARGRGDFGIERQGGNVSEISIITDSALRYGKLSSKGANALASDRRGICILSHPASEERSPLLSY